MPAQGDVLYLALEDSKRRLQRRMSKLLPAGTPWPRNLTLKTEWRRLHEGGLDDIRAWHADSKNKGGKPVLVIIDVLAKVRKPTGNKQLYEADYEALTGLTRLAGELGLAVVVVAWLKLGRRSRTESFMSPKIASLRDSSRQWRSPTTCMLACWRRISTREARW